MNKIKHTFTMNNMYITLLTSEDGLSRMLTAHIYILNPSEWTWRQYWLSLQFRWQYRRRWYVKLNIIRAIGSILWVEIFNNSMFYKFNWIIFPTFYTWFFQNRHVHSFCFTTWRSHVIKITQWQRIWNEHNLTFCCDRKIFLRNPSKVEDKSN